MPNNTNLRANFAVNLGNASGFKHRVCGSRQPKSWQPGRGLRYQLMGNCSLKPSVLSVLVWSPEGCEKIASYLFDNFINKLIDCTRLNLGGARTNPDSPTWPEPFAGDSVCTRGPWNRFCFRARLFCLRHKRCGTNFCVQPVVLLCGVAQKVEGKRTNLRMLKYRNRLKTDVTVAFDHCTNFYFPIL